MRRLARGEATVGELAAPFSMSFQAVSKHVRVLEHAGLVARSRRAQQRPCRLRPQAMAPIDRWLGDYRELWKASFDRLDVLLDDPDDPANPADEGQADAAGVPPRTTRSHPSDDHPHPKGTQP